MYIIFKLLKTASHYKVCLRLLHDSVAHANLVNNFIDKIKYSVLYKFSVQTEEKGFTLFLNQLSLIQWCDVGV